MQKERIKFITGLNGAYGVSDKGNVYSFLRKNMRQLSHTVSNSGFNLVVIRENHKSRLCSVHRLVASAFNPLFDEDYTVKHLDGNKQNNRADNLITGGKWDRSYWARKS